MNRIVTALKINIASNLVHIISQINNKPNLEKKEKITFADSDLKSAIELNIDNLLEAEDFVAVRASLNYLKYAIARRGLYSEFYTKALDAVVHPIKEVPGELASEVIKLALKTADVDVATNVELLTKGVGATSARILLNEMQNDNSIFHDIMTNKENSPAFQKAIQEGLQEFTEPQDERYPFIRDQNIAAQVESKTKDPSFVDYVFSFIERTLVENSPWSLPSEIVSPTADTAIIGRKINADGSPYSSRVDEGNHQSMPLSSTGPTGNSYVPETIDNRAMGLGGNPPDIDPVDNNPSIDLMKKVEKIKEHLANTEGVVYEAWENSFKYDKDLSIAFSQLHKKVRNILEYTDRINKNIKPIRR